LGQRSTTGEPELFAVPSHGWSGCYEEPVDLLENLWVIGLRPNPQVVEGLADPRVLDPVYDSRRRPRVVQNDLEALQAYVRRWLKVRGSYVAGGRLLGEDVLAQQEVFESGKSTDEPPQLRNIAQPAVQQRQRSVCSYSRVILTSIFVPLFVQYRGPTPTESVIRMNVPH